VALENSNLARLARPFAITEKPSANLEGTIDLMLTYVETTFNRSRLSPR
jgi:hypothetical protein